MRKMIATASPFELLFIPGFSLGESEDNNHKRSLFHRSTGAKSVNKQTSPKNVTITPFQALAAAQEVLPDETIVSLNTKTLKGVVIYQVCFSNGQCIDIRATDGQVIRS